MRQAGSRWGLQWKGLSDRAEMIAVMDRSCSPERRASAPAITGQEDFAELHIRPL